MSDSEIIKADTSAEEAYAKASEAAAPAKAPTLEAPAKVIVTDVAPVPVAAKAEAPALVIPSVRPKVAAKPKAVTKPKSVKPKVAAKPKAKPAAKVKPVAKLTAVKKPAPKPAKVAAVKPATAPKSTPAPTLSAKAKTKDTKMSIKDKVTGGLETVFGEAQAKAKEAYEKSTVIFSEAAAFTKGNVEAVVESGKILAGGLQDMSTNLVAEGRSVFEAASADIKQMAAAKSPTDLIQLQSEMFRKNFDSAVAYGSKNTEAFIKLASETVAPISSRFSLAVEKVRQVAR